jgi:hypothetical protein
MRKKVVRKKSAPTAKPSALSPQHLSELKLAVDKVHCLLKEKSLGSPQIRSLYGALFGLGTFSQYTKSKSKPAFVDFIYPRLTEEYFAVDIRNAVQDHLTWTTPQELLSLAAQDSPLTRLLAGYIWKRGELGRVSRVREGIRVGGDNRSAGDGPAVMWQFGRHLADRDSHPICDQHTYRASVLLIDAAKPGFNINRSIYSARHGALKLPKIEKYIAWWKKTLKDKLPGDWTNRQDTLYELDRLLFSLGKAALVPSTNADDDE